MQKCCQENYERKQIVKGNLPYSNFLHCYYNKSNMNTGSRMNELISEREHSTQKLIQVVFKIITLYSDAYISI